MLLIVQVQALGSDDHYPLFNATMSFNRTKMCVSPPNNASKTPQQQAPPTTMPGTAIMPSRKPLDMHHSTCEALQAIGTSSNFCQVKPNSCQAIECSVLNEYRFALTILPCNTVAGVNIQLDHLLDGTLLEDTFTHSQNQAIYFGESKILDLSVTVEQRSEGKHITFQV